MYPTDDSPGYGSFVKNVCDKLNELGMIVKYKSLIRGKPNSKADKIKKYLKFYYSIFINFFGKYDFIYIHFPNQAVPLLSILFFLKKPKTVVNFHGEDLVYSDSGYENVLGNLTEKFCNKYASAIVVPSEYFKSIADKRRLIHEDKIIVSPSGGINPSYFYPNVDKSHLDISKEIYLGYVGRLEKEKGVIEYIETCKQLKIKGITFKGYIIGYGTLYEYVLNFINDNRLEQDIQIINGVSQSELGNYYRQFDLLIFSSSARTGESLGLTGIEAMACGTPVIGSDIGGISSYLKDSINGFSVPKNNVSKIIDAIKKYRSLSIEEKETMRANCINTGKRYYNDLVCMNLSEDIRKVLSY